MNTWKTFNFKENFRHLDNTIEVKLYNNKVVSIWNVVGGKPFNNKAEEINVNDIGWFRAKKDLNRYKTLQKHHETLEQYDFETLDNFEFAIYDTYTEQEDRDKITKLFKKLTKHIEAVRNIIEKESKKFL